jgi:hypothetical protein
VGRGSAKLGCDVTQLPGMAWLSCGYGPAKLGCDVSKLQGVA